MDHAGGIGNPEAVEVFAQLLDLIPARDAVHAQICRRRFRVVRLDLEPDVGMAQVWHFVDPEPVWTELKNAALGGFLDQRQSERVAIERDRLIISVIRTLNGDIRTARELWTLKFGNHSK